MNRRPASAAATLLGTGAAAISVAIGLGFLGHLHPALDSFSHFRLHLSALAVVTGLLLLPMRRFLAGIGSVAVGAAAAFVTIGGAGSSPVSAEPGNAQPVAHYRLLHLNLRYDNAEPGKVISMIGRLRPDVVVLNEVSEMWQERIAHIRAMYPHGIVCPPPSRIGGVAILSRRPLADAPECHERGSLATARVDFLGTPIDVAALHLGWPWPFDQPRRLPTVRARLAQLGDSAIVAGDFNAVFWSWAVRSIAAEARLRIVRGVGPTWLALGLPDVLRRSIGLPIDHVLVKGGVISHSIGRLEDAGSDHLPILYEFSLMPQEPRQEVLRAGL